MQGTSRIAINTSIVYGKAVLTVVISLYTTRLILSALGESDFGLFNVVGGFVVLLSFLNTAMVVSTQRNISFSMGKNLTNEIKKVFANSMLLHFFIGILLVVIFETGGFYFLNNEMKIAPDRIFAANLLFQFVVVSTFVSVIAVPYEALINAHENMLALSIIGVIDVILKFAIAIYISFTSYDKLLTYGFLLMLSSFFIVFIKRFYVRKKYSKYCHVSIKQEYDKYCIKNLLSFAGWNTFGALCVVIRSQGISVIFNLFFGTIINAAYAAAYQLANQLTFFSSTILQVVNPQIMKKEGANNRESMLRLSLFTCKICYFLLAFIAIPFFFESESILKVWLKNVPDYTVIFANLLLLSILINQLTIGLQPALQAIGRIREYQSIVGSLLLFNLPLAFVLLKLGFTPYMVLLSYCLLEFAACFVRLYLLHRIGGLLISDYIKRVLIREVVPTIVSAFVCVFIVKYFEFNYRFVLTIIISSIFFFISVYFVGLCKDEKQEFKKIFVKLKNRIFI